jgi:AcrR family transcriptional regulator
MKKERGEMDQETMKTRQRIEKAAVTLFSQLGYDGVGMRAIAGQAGVAVSVIYYYFKNKEVLYRDVVLGSFQNVMEKARLYIEEHKGEELKSIALGLLEATDALPESDKERLRIAVYEIMGFGKTNLLREELASLYKQYEMVFYSFFWEKLKKREESFASSRVLFAYLSGKAAQIVIKGSIPRDATAGDLSVLC